MYQSDFCLAQFIDFVLTGMNKQIHTGMILVDLQKAINALDHGSLLQKMEYFGFQTSAIKWLESYLSKRKCLSGIGNFFFSGWNIKVRCTTRLYSWTTPCFIICK